MKSFMLGLIFKMLKFMKFLLVGGVNTLFGYGIFAGMIYIGLHYAIAAFVGTVLGILFNFQTTGRLVFKSHDPSKIWKFFAVYVIVYAVNVGSLYLLELIIYDIYLSSALLILPLSILSYTLLKKHVFGVTK